MWLVDLVNFFCIGFSTIIRKLFDTKSCWCTGSRPGFEPPGHNAAPIKNIKKICSGMRFRCSRRDTLNGVEPMTEVTMSKSYHLPLNCTRLVAVSLLRHHRKSSLHKRDRVPFQTRFVIISQNNTRWATPLTVITTEGHRSCKEDIGKRYRITLQSHGRYAYETNKF